VCKPGRSKKIINIMLSTLSPSCINKLSRCLVRRQRDLPQCTLNCQRRRMKNAVIWVRRVKSQLNLQDLSRRVIRRTMSHRSLAGLSSLDIPEHLKGYILLKDF